MAIEDRVPVRKLSFAWDNYITPADRVDNNRRQAEEYAKEVAA